MDSLLVVLVVIGVVMILAGIARMRSKRRHSWDEIDHSVLFSKDDHDIDAVVSGSASVAVDVDGKPESGYQKFDSLVNHDADVETPEIHVDDERDEQPTQSGSVGGRARSILGKLRGDIKTGEEPEPVEPGKKTYKTGAPDKVVVLNVMAQQGRTFVGQALVDVIQSSGMQHGDMQIFHHQTASGSVFSLVNMVQPGVFDLNSVETISTPGISLFMQMPNSQADGLSGFDTMLETAQQLAQRLGGELRDETRSVLTSSAIDHIRQQIAEYDCKWLA